jgi:amidohydrolase
MISKIKHLAKAYHAETVAMRRHLHQHPELSFQEKETAAFVSKQLTSFGIAHQRDVAGHGIVALIYGQEPDSQVIALRGDMDALPIAEQNDVPYKSKHTGVMHACGHDVHTSSLLGTARILQELRSEWKGTIKLLFQPAEEKLPGGASLMIADGALTNPAPTAILGQHVHPSLEAGKVGFRGGMFMASADELYLTLKGRGGHGAMPHECIDPIAMAAQVIVALQQVVSRYGNPTIPSVLTFGKIQSVGGGTNIIPTEVVLEGTFRTMDEPWREEAHKRIRKIAKGIAEGMGGACDCHIERGYPALINDEKLTAETMAYATEYLGAENVVTLPIRMTAEDFAYYSQVMPACFYRIGTGNVARGITSAVHTATFDIDEAALETSVGLMAWLAVKRLEEQ